MRDLKRVMGRHGERVIEDDLFNLGNDKVGISPFAARQFVEQALGAIGLISGSSRTAGGCSL